ncbi:hypothetical protein SAMN05428936_101559 [Pelagibacterium halotolerans]|nr:hypothetical protein SAMN05428936_101559 [Pelagibacterium halotolerans]
MFVLRSAFWLSAAFLVMAPSTGMDVGASARATGDQLASQGVRAVSETLMPSDCGSVECVIGRTVLSQIATQRAPAGNAFPPPRPDWAY